MTPMNGTTMETTLKKKKRKKKKLDLHEGLGQNIYRWNIKCRAGNCLPAPVLIQTDAAWDLNIVV